MQQFTFSAANVIAAGSFVAAAGLTAEARNVSSTKFFSASTLSTRPAKSTKLRRAAHRMHRTSDHRADWEAT